VTTAALDSFLKSGVLLSWSESFCQLFLSPSCRVRFLSFPFPLWLFHSLSCFEAYVASHVATVIPSSCLPWFNSWYSRQLCLQFLFLFLSFFFFFFTPSLLFFLLFLSLSLSLFFLAILGLNSGPFTARQVLYHLRHVPRLFWFCYFWDTAVLLCTAGLDHNPLYISLKAGMTGTCHHAQLLMGSS
jgi:hypothetical protein